LKPRELDFMRAFRALIVATIRAPLAHSSDRRSHHGAGAIGVVAHRPWLQIARGGKGQGQMDGVEIRLARSASYRGWAATLTTPPTTQFVHCAVQKSPSGSSTQSESALQDWS
jgi:hypothetical protein